MTPKIKKQEILMQIHEGAKEAVLELFEAQPDFFVEFVKGTLNELQMKSA